MIFRTTNIILIPQKFFKTDQIIKIIIKKHHFTTGEIKIISTKTIKVSKQITI